MDFHSQVSRHGKHYYLEVLTFNNIAALNATQRVADDKERDKNDNQTDEIFTSVVAPYLLADEVAGELDEILDNGGGATLSSFFGNYNPITQLPPSEQFPLSKEDESSRASQLHPSSFPTGGVELVKFEEFLTTTIDSHEFGQRHNRPISPETAFFPFGKLHHLLARIEEQIAEAEQRRALQSLLIDSQPRHSKWFDPNRPGQAELYDELERVLIQLRNYTPHSGPFLHRVSKKEVPDYYEVIKRPMDLGTMGKKLRAHLYRQKEEFERDLQLLYRNCYTYNTDPASPLRKNVEALKERWTQLMRSVPEIVVTPITNTPSYYGVGNTESSSSSSIATTTTTTTITTNNNNNSGGADIQTTAITAENMAGEVVDEIDHLLKLHLDQLSPIETIPASSRATTGLSRISVSSASHSGVIIGDTLVDGGPTTGKEDGDGEMASFPSTDLKPLNHRQEVSHFNALKWPLPMRSPKLMGLCSHGQEEGSIRELFWFHQSLPPVSSIVTEPPILLGKTSVTASSSAAALSSTVPPYLMQTVLGFKRLRDVINNVDRQTGYNLPSSFTSPLMMPSLGNPQTVFICLARIVAWLTLQVGYESSNNAVNSILTTLIEVYLFNTCLWVRNFFEAERQGEEKEIFQSTRVTRAISLLIKELGVEKKDLQRLLISHPALTHRHQNLAIEAVYERRRKLEADALQQAAIEAASQTGQLDESTNPQVAESDLDLDMLLDGDGEDELEDDIGSSISQLSRPSTNIPLSDTRMSLGEKRLDNSMGMIEESLAIDGHNPISPLLDRKRTPSKQYSDHELEVDDEDEEIVVELDGKSRSQSSHDR